MVSGICLLNRPVIILVTLLLQSIVNSIQRTKINTFVDYFELPFMKVIVPFLFLIIWNIEI